MPWLKDLVTLIEDANAGDFGVDLFTSTKATRPLLASGTISVVETSGSGPERTQNSVIRPAYIRPAAQIMVSAPSYDLAKQRAQACYDAITGIRNSWVTDYVTSGWYREIKALQEPFDAGVDDRGRARCGFNVVAVRRPD